MELPVSVHNAGHKQLHINTSDIPSGINRSAFNVLKSAYWKRRAAQGAKASLRSLWRNPSKAFCCLS